MANSIITSLDENYTVAEIKLLLASSRTKTIVVVEGDDDVRLFTTLLAEDVSLVQSFHSKLGVESWITSEFAGQNRVIGIRDKDYQIAPLDDRIFYCDYCCSEMMIISNDSCFSRVFSNYCNVPIPALDLREKCLRCLELLSKLRFMNETNNWKVKFDGVKPAVLYNNNQTTMNDNIITSLNNMNPENCLSESRIELLKNRFPNSFNQIELLEITNGHDFIELMHGLGKVKESIKALGKGFRTSFGKLEFVNTLLYKHLNNYQVNNNLHIVD